MDQLSPEYGGMGRRREDLPSLADALFAAGSPAGADKDGAAVGGGGGGDLKDGVRPRGKLAQGGPCASPMREREVEEDKEEEEEEEQQQQQQEEEEEEEPMSSKENGRKGWFGVGAGASSWGPLGWMWSAWGGSGGAANSAGVRGDAEESIVAADEEVRMPFIFARVCLAGKHLFACF